MSWARTESWVQILLYLKLGAQTSDLMRDSIGRTDPAGRHRLAVASDTDEGRAWYIPTVRVTIPQLVSRLHAG